MRPALTTTIPPSPPKTKVAPTRGDLAAAFGEAFAAASLRRASAGEPAWATQLRQEAFRRAAHRGWPTRRDEDFKYLSLSGFLAEGAPFALLGPRPLPKVPTALVAPWLEADELTLIFVDGQLVTAAPGGDEVTVTLLSRALQDRSEALRSALETSPVESHGVFGDLATAFLGAGVLVEIKGAVRKPIHLLHVITTTTDGDARLAFFPRHVLALGDGAEASVIETFIGPESAEAYLVGAATTVQLGRGARLQHARLQLEGEGGYHFGALKAQIAPGAELATLSYSRGGRLARMDLEANLTGEGSKATLDGLYEVHDRQVVDHHTTIDHQAPGATSRQLYKGIAGGSARAVFNGKVVVRAGAQGTDSHQLCRNLLLSDEAEIDVKPELKIDADDVKCAHGATVSQLNPTERFYLESRGLHRERAEAMLLKAFARGALGGLGGALVARRLGPQLGRTE